MSSRIDFALTSRAVKPLLELLLLSPFLLLLAACGGGGGGSAMPIPPMQEWQQVALPSRGIPSGLDVCGPAVVAQFVSGAFAPLAESSLDHGLTWQGSPLAGALRELGDSGDWWRAGGNPATPAITTDGETHDCGVTWIPIQGLEACIGHWVEVDLWRAGIANGTLYGQGSTLPPPNQATLCVSQDNGQTWSQGPPLPLNTMVVAVRSGHWFAIAVLGNPAPGVSSPNQLLRSDDNGQTWQSTGLFSANAGLTLIQTTAHGAVMCVIATNQNPSLAGPSVEVLWQWSDAQAAWTASPPFPMAINTSTVAQLAANPANPSQLFIAPQNGVYESRDGGNTWVDASNGFGGLVTIFLLLFDPTLANRLYAFEAEQLWALNVAP